MKNMILFVIFLIILVSCGNEPPAVNFPLYNIVIYQNGSLNVPNDGIFLSVHFLLQAENGVEDIDLIRIIHQESEYSWILPKDIVLAQPVIWQDKTYYGYSFLEFNGARSILTGEYKIEVTDRAGNIAEAVFFVEVEGIIATEPFDIPEIKYQISADNKNKEIRITEGDYSSCEIKILNQPALFNSGRKKFPNGQKIVLNNNESMAKGTRISVRINREEEEKTIYFLKTFQIE
jgi:hypothetical protein